MALRGVDYFGAFSHRGYGASTSALLDCCRCPALWMLTQWNAWLYIVKSHRDVTGQGPGAVSQLFSCQDVPMLTDIERMGLWSAGARNGGQSRCFQVLVLSWGWTDAQTKLAEPDDDSLVVLLYCQVQNIIDGKFKRLAG